MNDAVFTLVVLAIVAAYAFMFGMQFGAYRERRWQIEKRKMNAKLSRYQREVDQACDRYVALQDAEDYMDQRVN